jgi:diacylglycerol kinase (CTP)
MFSTPHGREVTNWGRMQQEVLKQKSDIHLSRKLWHCVGICVMAALYNLMSPKASYTLLIFATLFFLPLDYLRQKNQALNKLTIRIFGAVMRKHEAQAISGMSYLFVGCMVLLMLRDRHLITLTLLFLAFGDPIASYFGIRYGKDKIFGNKSLQGTMAAFGACTAISIIYYWFNNLMIERLLIVAPLSGLIGALAEALPIGKLDDNFTFPVVAGGLLWLLFKVYGG